MRKAVAYKKYKALYVKQLKLALSLPSKGKVEPMLEMFPTLDPENIVIKSYLRSLK